MTDLAALTARAERWLSGNDAKKVSDATLTIVAADLIRDLLTYATTVTQERDEAERHDCERWQMEGVGCALCNPIAVSIREQIAGPGREWHEAIYKLQAELARAEQERDAAIARAEQAEARVAYLEGYQSGVKP